MSVSQARHALSGAGASLARAIVSVIATEGATDTFYVEHPGSGDAFPRTAVFSRVTPRNRASREL